MSQDPVLLLRICGKGFAKLAAGQIKAKYREAKPYWQKRLLKPDGQPRSFSAVHIRNGYRADAPLAVFAFGGISVQLQEHEGKPCYRIDHGPLIEIRHYGDNSESSGKSGENGA